MKKSSEHQRRASFGALADPSISRVYAPVRQALHGAEDQGALVLSFHGCKIHMMDLYSLMGFKRETFITSNTMELVSKWLQHVVFKGRDDLVFVGPVDVIALEVANAEAVRDWLSVRNIMRGKRCRSFLFLSDPGQIHW